MSLAYLVNQHPKCSQSFIRREILAVEAQGIPVKRFSVRSGEDLIVDPADQAELEKTRVILGVGALGLAQAVLKTLIRNPIKFLKALRFTYQVGAKSDRGLPVHFIYLAEACVLKGWLQREGVRHIHVHFGTNSTMVAMLCRALGGPTYSFTVHGPEEFDRVTGIGLKAKIKHAAFVVGISSFGRSQLYRWCNHSEWDKLHIVHCGVDDAYLTQPVGTIPEAPNLVCVGRLCEQKGQLLLVEAIRRLVAEGVPCHLTLVGDGEHRGPIETLIQQHQLQNHIKITGYATGDQVQKYILNSRAFVLPSFGEGLPVAIMEALALGRPVVTSYIAGIPELIKPGQNGWLVPAGDVDTLVGALRQVLSTGIDQLEQMGQRGAEAVAQEHNVHTEAQKLKRLFDTCLF
ncbi:glycosyltransferase [filamentous cyanobacterium LEGE 11480]|uniref:Glycosyltransferase n=1 Tax=Romeriopsis navalis LEGE 11480 TaxID=2777977 RepID=A0A928VNR0_9CYAN|nr:glycosyltransferase [Romeriopsis navalis]MBE9029767.1 glycosyltransferase [Romeriopsis navalis LEGE 11480]